MFEKFSRVKVHVDEARKKNMYMKIFTPTTMDERWGEDKEEEVSYILR